MAKEWILNIATNRWGLNKKQKVGPVALWIRECSPSSKEEWECVYYQRLLEMLEQKGIPLSPREYIDFLGRELYKKITENIRCELDEVREEDCIEYIRKLVIDKTYEGYKTEISTIYGQLEKILKVKIHPAPDEWDRLYNVDFYIKVRDHIIGLQIKPITYEQTPEIHRWKEWLTSTHKKFEETVGGKVFTIFSVKKGDKKNIYNLDVINEIKSEIDGLLST